MARGSGSPFTGAPRRVPGGPHRIPGAPHRVPGGPSRSGAVRGSKINSGFGSFITTAPDEHSSGAWRDVHTGQIRDMQGRFAGPSGIAWQGLDSLSAGLHEYGERVERARQRAFDELAEEMEAWAKENAPWDDDTTDARQGLHAHAIHSGPRSVVWIAHSADVKYGIWLEIMQNGRFAILLPTVLHFAPQVGGKVAGRV